MLALVLGVGGFAYWYDRQHPRRIVGHGSVRVTSQRAGGGTATHATRDVMVDHAIFKEVAMPNGTWIGCGGVRDDDCVKAARDAGDGFWDKQQRDRR